ncbi:MAG: response regulator [Candidatus Levybacteria bacterium]|nr:response regulator [Candidatus Levybacteria bacterium]
MNENPTILVIEDEELLRIAIVKKLVKSNITPVACSSGRQALDYLKQAHMLPDAIWLDYYLRDMNGLEFMDELKKNSIWATIPVFVVSNSASTTKVHNMLALGAKRYVLKAEHRLDDIIAEIHAYISAGKKENTATKQ